MSSQDLQPNIRFGGKDIPAHQVWPKTKLLYGVNEFLARFNELMPGHASERSIAVVPEVRRRLKAIEVAIPKRFQATPEMIKDGREALRHLPVEDALAQFNATQEQDLSMGAFIEIVGARAYYCALREEAREWKINKILPSQTAEIWNEQNRPAPGDPDDAWTGEKIERLLGGGFT